jgi:DNA-binding MurR/RpiR family transcriptional regulator
MTASRLGEVTNVSESTVVRFATALGYEGYPELQLALQELIRIRLTSVQRMEVTNDRIGEGDVLESVLNSDMAKIRSTLDTVSRADFAAASDAIVNAKRIYIIGMRSSASLASFLAFNFRFMFDNVTLVQTTSGSEIFEQLLRVSEGDVVIAISFPRYSKRIINAVEFAHMQGAHIVALTDSALSPIATHADSTLYAKSDMASFVDSLVAPLSIMNALIVDIARKKKVELQNVFSRLETIWDEYDVYDKDSHI